MDDRKLNKIREERKLYSTPFKIKIYCNSGKMVVKQSWLNGVRR